MRRLVNDLLLLGQAEAGEFLQRAPVELDGLLAEVAEQARAQADERSVELGPLEPLTTVGDRDRLKQLLWNLVENALRYTPPSGTIRLSLGREDGWAELAVVDDGPGIPAEQLPRVFDRFYRVDRARSRATGGAGLGLAIVKHIAQAHGGSVSVQSTLGLGSAFWVRLPAEPRKQESAMGGRDGEATVEDTSPPAPLVRGASQ
jgi:two-component system, OmpR family, sensor kinase